MCAGGEGAEQLDAAEAARIFEGQLAGALLAEDGQLALSSLASNTLSTLMPKLETQGRVGQARCAPDCITAVNSTRTGRMAAAGPVGIQPQQHSMPKAVALGLAFCFSATGPVCHQTANKNKNGSHAQVAAGERAQHPRAAQPGPQLRPHQRAVQPHHGHRSRGAPAWERLSCMNWQSVCRPGIAFH